MTDPVKNEKEEGVRAAGKEVRVIKFGFADLINDLKPADFNPAAQSSSASQIYARCSAFRLFLQARDDQIKKKNKSLLLSKSNTFATDKSTKFIKH